MATHFLSRWKVEIFDTHINSQHQHRHQGFFQRDLMNQDFHIGQLLLWTLNSVLLAAYSTYSKPIWWNDPISCYVCNSKVSNSWNFSSGIYYLLKYYIVKRIWIADLTIYLPSILNIISEKWRDVLGLRRSTHLILLARR